MLPFSKRLRSCLKLKTALTIFILLVITIAFTNFFILLSVQTNVHKKASSFVESVFLIHIRRNISISGDVEVPQMPRKGMFEGTQGTVRDKLSSEENNPTRNASVRKEQLITQLTRSTIKTRSKTTTNIKTTVKPVLKSVDSNPVPPSCTTWCYRGDGLKPPYLLTAVLLVRIYPHDLAKLSSREMFQWLQYLRYAGFQHVYVYDAYVKPTESQHDVIKPFVQSGYATYIDWSIHNPYSIQGTQVLAYQHCINKFGKDSRWQAAIDIDEYPFSPSDVDENFMSRFLEQFSSKHPEVSEITMKNFLFLGKPIDTSQESLLIARIRRRTHNSANALVKPIYKPGNIAWAQVHHNGIKIGSTMDSPALMLRMNHYWGARLQNWGEDTPKVLEMTEPDYTIEPIVKRIKECGSCLGKDGLFVHRWA